MITRSTLVRRSAGSAFNSAAGIVEGRATRELRLGAKRSISAAQLANSDAGATSKLGRGGSDFSDLKMQRRERPDQRRPTKKTSQAKARSGLRPATSGRRAFPRS